MATKTLTITEDVYNLLVADKLENESFSEEIRRILSKKKTKKLVDFFGILSCKEGEGMLKDLNRIKAKELAMLKERV